MAKAKKTKELNLLKSAHFDYKSRDLHEHLSQKERRELSHENLAEGVTKQLNHELDVVIPWFLTKMPNLYYHITPLSIQLEHLTELVSRKVLSENQTVEEMNSRTKVSTFISPGEKGKGMVDMGSKIGRESTKQANVFLSLDNKVAIGSLYHTDYTLQKEIKSKGIQKKFEEFVSLQDKKEKKESLKSFFLNLDKDYVKNSTPHMMGISYQAVKYCEKHENSFISETHLNKEGTIIRVDVGLKGLDVNTALENIIGLFDRYQFMTTRVLGSEIISPSGQKFAIFHVVAILTTGEKVTKELQQWGRVLKGLNTLSFIDHSDSFSHLLKWKRPYSLSETNFIRAMANWSHIFLSRVNPYYYSLDRVSAFLTSNGEFIESLLYYFRVRLDPRFEKEREKEEKKIVKKIDKLIYEIEDEIEIKVLKECRRFIRNILKTNYFMVAKTALSFRMNPDFLNKEYYPNTPYGIIYIVGRDFRAFQVRYRDISRGGMRIVMPRTMADYESVLAGIFDEVNGLAYAQQQKNKDIPEGGSKAVLVLRPGGDRHHAVKSAISGLLDLIIVDKKTNKLDKKIIDHYGKEELIYLGPDENMTNDLIHWITNHALHRGYKFPYAFMSSKPDMGINHKEYGVTSEGVNVYLDNLLEHLGLKDGKTPFRVKMTGGPDGDVAGNELNILYREYGERCRVVAVADGLGAAFDPKGLSWKELLRLFKEGLSIVHFSKSCLSKTKESFVIEADEKKKMQIRNELYAKAEAEVFIPAGGRPFTVNDKNWKSYLMPDGRPSSLAIVEGANIFFTPKARYEIMNSGVLTFKDSSANKGGVIASSYEIIACLVLSKEEWPKIKKEYVEQVINILKSKADLEAKLILKELKKRGGETTIVDLSLEVSQEINRAKDIFSERLNKLSDKELNSNQYTYILFHHIPRVLVAKYSDRILKSIPRAHRIAIISAFLASRLVYREGLNWLETMDQDTVFQIGMDYMKAEQYLDKIILEIDKSRLKSKKAIKSILMGSGAKHIASNKINVA